MVKNPSLIQEPWVQSLGQEDTLEKGMATHSSSGIENPMNRGAWWSHVRKWRSKGHLAPLMRPTKFPEIPVSLERNPEVFGQPLL